MILAHSLRSEAENTSSLFLVLTIIVLVTFFIISTFSVQNIYAAEITLAWDQNSEPDIAGYRIYYGQESHSLSLIHI